MNYFFTDTPQMIEFETHHLDLKTGFDLDHIQSLILA